MPEKVRQPGPVMLHGLWRSGSTYVWSRFRQDPATICYYEPLNEGKAFMLAKKHPPPSAALQAVRRHPQVDRPYDAEYVPLINARGVPDFKPAFSYERYVLNADEEHVDLERYLSSLIEAARLQEKTPVLAFNRTTTRIGWIRKHFPSSNVWIDRHPRQVWQSYAALWNSGNPYFIARWPLIVGQNADCELLKPVVPLFGFMGKMQRYLPRGQAGWARLQARLLAWSSLYQAFFYIWLLSVFEALRYADVIVDMEQAQVDTAYRESVQREILRHTGLGVDFGDISLPLHDDLPTDYFTEAEARACRALQHAPLPWSEIGIVLERRSDLLSDDKVALVRAALP